MSSLAALRTFARRAVTNAVMRMGPRATAAAPFRVAPAIWARSFASGGFLPKEEVSARVLDVVKNFQNVDPAKVTATSHFMNDLGLDSLDTVEVGSCCPRCAQGSTSRSCSQTRALLFGAQHIHQPIARQPSDLAQNITALGLSGYKLCVMASE